MKTLAEFKEAEYQLRQMWGARFFKQQMEKIEKENRKEAEPEKTEKPTSKKMSRRKTRE